MTQDLIFSLDKTKYSAPVVVSKQGAAQTAANFYQKIMDGEVNAVDIVEAFKYVEDTYKALKSCTDDMGKNGFSSLVRDEIQKNADDGKKYSSKNGTVFTLAETGTTYDYSACNDTVWNDFQHKLSDLKDQIKDREDYLKTIKKPVKVLDESTGEVVELLPCIKTSTSSFKAELLKD